MKKLLYYTKMLSLYNGNIIWVQSIDGGMGEGGRREGGDLNPLLTMKWCVSLELVPTGFSLC